jgi:hypothetical protein
LAFFKESMVLIVGNEFLAVAESYKKHAFFERSEGDPDKLKTGFVGESSVSLVVVQGDGKGRSSQLGSGSIELFGRKCAAG